MKRSLYEGVPVRHPEELAGVWEAPDGRGGVVGLSLVFRTTIPANRTRVAGAIQKWQSLTAEIYERRTALPGQDERNFYVDWAQEGALRYHEGHLTLHGLLADLDVWRQPGQTWSGRFHREDFDQQVVLRRPQGMSMKPRDWFLGTWTGKTGASGTCLHVGRAVDGTIAGWTDSLSTLGSVRYAPQVQRPRVTSEMYGAPAEVHGSEGGIAVTLNVSNDWCCSASFVGQRQTADTMWVQWKGGPGSPVDPKRWHRVRGMSCIE